ncbi:AgmX/PglI C-terminal domain-containing protein [Paraglaciecola sp. MB-3u-78]|jgi:protein TonB|uniref:AgmX/PglI C-terminal domain-containing protein n=1 Tax=Paraglaciecola sp. MB-3u-78 TaxID=2058332 RepID=UPI000C31DA9B|nr:AgmX/PglI C-terminal domain-containing protein [Paraglaciecola sp. MB-3u-78]PKG98455.1 alcohol dehydrogenase [Paraglaciecola sp. MB-3u-78]
MNAAAMNVHTATANSKMSEPNSFITILPWSSSELENKRFKAITAVVLCITLAFAAMVKWQELPERPRAEKEKVPAQLTRLMTPRKVESPKPIPVPIPKPVIPKPLPEPKIEKPKPVPPKPTEPKKAAPKEIKKVPPKPVKLKVPTQAEITEQAKTKAKQSGLLAFQDDLASMRDNVSLSNLADTNTIKGAGTSNQTQRKFIGKKVTGNSGGVDTSNLTTNIGSRGELAGRKNTEYVAPSEGLASLAAKQVVTEDSVLGSRQTENIRKVLDANKGAIYAIYRKALRSDPSLQGKVTVKLSIEPNGGVSNVELVFSELDSTDVENKLLSRIKLINFGEQNVSLTLLDYSFNFLPF